MKKTFITLIVILVSIQLFAQQKTNLVFFSQDGERFSIVLNGILQNDIPQTNIKVTGLNQPYYNVKVLFENRKLGEISKMLTFSVGTETTYVIKKNRKGVYKLRWQSEVPIAQAAPPSRGQNIIVFSTTPPIHTTTTHTERTTIVNNQSPTNNGVNMGININDPDLGVNINMNVNATDMNTQTSSYSTTTTTTTTSTDSYNYDQNQSADVYEMPGYTGPIGCPWPMNNTQFNRGYNSISSKTFDDTKLTIAKQVINTNCLTSNQVKKIMLLFTFEDTRLELAKWAYGHTFDIGNYYLLNDAFTFESTIEELNTYIGSYSW